MVLVDSKRPFFWILALLIASFIGIIIYQQYQKIAGKNQIVIFIGTKGNINEIVTMKPCPPDTKICPTYISKSPARFAIEVNAGFAVKNLIIEGDILEISGF